jgi:hypothetical protein
MLKHLFKSNPKTNSDARHHVVITGTGRAGTTFLVELLTYLGLDTGFTPKDLAKIMKSHSKAGLEWDIRAENAPYIIKSPWFCGYSDEIIKNEKFALDHVFLPFRDIEAAAASRIRVVKEHPPTELPPDKMIGGLMGTQKFEEQADILMRNIYTLLNALADSYVPVTLLSFPRFVNDADYCYKKMRPLLGKMKFPEFKKSFDTASHPEFVHNFEPKS